MTNRYYIEYQHAGDAWLVFESNSHGLRVVSVLGTVQEAAAEMSLLESIEGVCKAAQNGLTSADDLGAILS
jgi:hypothetical protein